MAKKAQPAPAPVARSKPFPRELSSSGINVPMPQVKPSAPDPFTVEQVPLARLFCSPNNPRRNEAAIDKVAGSIRKFGFRQPIVAKRTGEVIVGNTRLKAAHTLKLQTVPVLWWDGTDLDATAYMIADNRTSEFAAWDNRSLGALLQTLKEEDGGETLPATGFTEDDIADVLKKAEEEHGEASAKKPDLEFPEDRPHNAPPEFPTTRTGDVWKMGEHRLICGDSKVLETVKALFLGEPVRLMLTDPPYCAGGFQEANKKTGTWGRISGDNLSTRGLQTLLREVIGAAKPEAVYIFFDWRMWVYIVDVVESCGIPIRAMIVWDKESPALGAIWRTQVEYILFGSVASNLRETRIPASANLIRSKRSGNKHHYTEKPVDVLTQIITGDECTQRLNEATIYDPFTGSGSTLIACEVKKRVFRGAEIEPGYCDVAVLRWMDATKKQAVHEGTGKTFTEMQKERAKA